MASDDDPFRELCLAEQGQVNGICDTFEEALQQGAAPRLEDVLAETSDRVREVLFRELLVLECEYALRRQTDMERSRLAERFPGREALIEEAIELARSNLAMRPTPPDGATVSGHPGEWEGSVPETIGPFRLLSVLGHGSFGSVFRAVDTRHSAEVALKVPHIVTLVTPELRERFLREARVGALDHPRIVKVREVGEMGRVCYIVSDYVPGTTLASWLRERCERQEQVPFAQAARCTELLAEAIQHAHERDVLHCDLKPANVLLRDGPLLDPVVTDFGLARLVGDSSELTRTGQFFGTPAYMAPEQATGPRRKLGPTTDVYGLGAILYEMLTGRPPFQATSLLEILDRKRDGSPVSPRVLSPGLPRELDTICLKCLQTDPHRRYPNAQSLADDLRRFLEGQPIHARPVALAERLWLWARRRPVVAALALALLVSFGIGVCLGLGMVAKGREAVDALGREEVERKKAEESFTEALQVTAELVKLGQSAEVGVTYSPPGLQTTTARFQFGQSASEMPGAMRERLVKALTKAETHCRNLLRQRTEDVQARKTLAEVYLYLGKLRADCGQMEEGLAAVQEAQGLLQGLMRDDPANPALRGLLARAHLWLGVVHERRQASVQALSDFRRAYDLWRDLAEERPSFLVRRELAGSGHELMIRLLALRKWQDAQQVLEKHCVLVEQLVQESPADLSLHCYLIGAYMATGWVHSSNHRDDEAARWWQRANDAYERAVQSQPNDARFRMFHLAAYGSGLPGRFRAGSFSKQAPLLREQVGEALVRSVQDDPAFLPLREDLRGFCRLITQFEPKAGDQARLVEGCQWCVRSYERLLEQCPKDHDFGHELLAWLVRLEVLQNESGPPEAAQATERRIIQLLARHRSTGLPERDVRPLRADYLWKFAHELRRRGKPADALRLAEESHRLFGQLVKEAPEDLSFAVGLFNSYEQIGKAHVELHRPDKALAAWLQGVEVMRGVVERAPSNLPYRTSLASRYLNLSRHMRGHGRLAEAAGWLLEREKLLPANLDNLRELSREFSQLAAAVAPGGKDLSPAQQAERQRYLEQAHRLERAGAARP